MKKLFKRLILYVSILLVSPILLIVHIGIFLKFEYIFNTFGEFLSLFPGRLGSYLRVAYYKCTLEFMSENVVIEFGSFFHGLLLYGIFVCIFITDLLIH